MRLRLDPLAKSGVSVIPPIAPVITGGVGSSTGSSGVQSVVAGTNVTVDATDPANPIVSASGSGSSVWGTISGTLSNQTDLQTALDAKVPTTTTVNGHALSANVTVSKSDVSLGNVDNTSDATKNAAIAVLTNKDVTSGTNTFPTFNQNTTGSAAKLTTGRTISVTGDLAYTSPSFDGSGNITAAGTLATVNTNTGSFGSATQVAGFTVNGKGLITAASNTSIQIAESQVTNLTTDLAAKQGTVTLTTTGTNGASTFIGNTLNVPNYTYTLPTASTSVLGGVKVDGTSITISSGVISAVSGGSGTVTSVGITGSNGIGVSGSPITSTGSITLSLGAITPTTVNSVTISGSSTPTLAVTGTSSISGTNTGDQTITLTGDVTGLGTGSFVTTIKSSVVLAGNPTTTTQTPADNSTKIATTAYVDNAVLGQNFKEAVGAATTANLVGTYSNGVSGVGATFTYTATGVDTIDGVSLTLGMRVLLKNQTTAFQNGLYTVTTAGAVGVAGILTRATDGDQYTDWKTGDSVFVTAGTTLSTTTWAYTGIDSPTIGTTSLTFAQTAGQGSFTAGNGVSITGNSIAIDTSVTVDKTTAQTLTNKDLTGASNTFPSTLVATSGNQTVGGIKTFSANMEVDGGTLTLGNATSNIVIMPAVGFAAPTLTTRSVGAKIVLFNQLSGSLTDYALGINANTLWYSVPGTGQQHTWYAGTTAIMTLSGAGALSPTGNVTVASGKTLTLTGATIVNTGTLTLPTSTDTLVGRATADTLTNKTLTTPVIAQINDSNANTMLATSVTASAVNNIQIGNAATGGAPFLTVTGADADISYNIFAKGNGTVTLTNPSFSTVKNTGTLTLPTSTDTLIGRATTDTLTNKTYDTAGTGNSFKINGTAVTAVTGSGSNVLATAPTMTTPVIDQFGSASGLGSSYASWTPTWTNLTIGNGSVNPTWKQIGKTTFFKIILSFGTTTTVTGQVTFSLPSTIVGEVIMHSAYYFDTSASTFFPLFVQQASSTTAKLYAFNAAATASMTLTATSATVPVAFGTGDTFEIMGSYENT